MNRPHEPDDARVDELRQRLRSLGYLDAGVDRFVLGSARSARRPTAIAGLASLRVGALAALLLGPAAALGLSARVPGLVVGPRDAVVVAIYLGAFFGIAATVATLIATLAVSWLARRAGTASARRGRTLSVGAGAFVTLLCLIYLTLWWQTVIAGLGWSAPFWTLSALAVAAAMSLLLGHAVSVAASAVVLAAAKTVDTGPAPRSWRTTVAAGALAFGGAALLLTWSAAATPRADPTRDTLTVVPPGLRVRVIAIDGFDARIFDELASAGRVPALAGMIRGTRAELTSPDGDAGDPARAWTTIATGQPVDVHGVHGLETRRVAGMQGSVAIAEPSPLGRAIRGATDLVRLTRPSIASGSERRAKSFWEVAAGAGLRTAVVNWWATWPAADPGIVLSDRATLRLERGGPLDAEMAPASLYEPLRQRWPDIKAKAAARAGDALDYAGDSGALALLRRSAEIDAVQLELLADVAGPTTDLAVVYLPGLDIAQHSLLGSEQSGLAASTLGVRLDALKAYYAALDRLLAAPLNAAPSPVPTSDNDELVVLVTGPGRVREPGAASLAARGPMIRPRSSQHAATSVAPTILYALGIPLARDLPSTPIVELFEPQFVARYPIREVATYGQPAAPKPSPAGQALDREMVDRLRSLGYVR